MKDALGNEIREGDLLHWVNSNLPVLKVLKVEEGGLSIGNSNKATTPRLTLQFTIEVRDARPGDPVNLPQFLVVMNPEHGKIMGII